MAPLLSFFVFPHPPLDIHAPLTVLMCQRVTTIAGTNSGQTFILDEAHRQQHKSLTRVFSLFFCLPFTYVLVCMRVRNRQPSSLYNMLLIKCTRRTCIPNVNGIVTNPLYFMFLQEHKKVLTSRGAAAKKNGTTLHLRALNRCRRQFGPRTSHALDCNKPLIFFFLSVSCCILLL